MLTTLKTLWSISPIKRKFDQLKKDESGQGMVEYGLIIGLIVIIIIAAFAFLGGPIENMFSDVGDKIENKE